MTTLHPIRRALRVLNLFTLVSLNPPSPYATPYTTQMIRQNTGPRVF
jgi:hypothetical protein